MSNIIKLDDLEIEPLTEMCRDAYEETAWALENTLKKAIHFGRLLCIAKKKVPHGKWISWVAETFEDQVSLRNIQRFMQVAESNTTDPSLLEGAKNLDEAMGRIQMKKPVDDVAADEPRDIAAEVAAECGVTREQIIQDGIYAEAVDVVSKTDPDIRAKVRAGKVTQAEVIAVAKAASTAKPTKTKSKPTEASPAKPKPANTTKTANPTESKADKIIRMYADKATNTDQVRDGIRKAFVIIEQHKPDMIELVRVALTMLTDDELTDVLLICKGDRQKFAVPTKKPR